MWYPEQQTTNITPYRWTFHLQGHDNTVENVTLINSYNGISIGPEGNVRHRIRSVYGCVLRRGILVDACTDIGRIENVQFHCHWWSAPEVHGDWKPVHEFMWKNCEAFIFGRTDWEYVNNTFVYPVNVGYRFIRTKAGMANGQFSGIGADEAQICLKVEEIQPMGLLISNGQFVCMHGEPAHRITGGENLRRVRAARELLVLGAGTAMRRVAQPQLRLAVGLLFQQQRPQRKSWRFPGGGGQRQVAGSRLQFWLR